MKQNVLKLARSPRSLTATLAAFTLITRTAPCLRQLPSCVAVYPRDSRSRRVLSRSSHSLDSCFPRRFSREALAHRNHPGRTDGFSRKTRRAFLSREADYRLDLQKTRRLLRRDDRFAE